MVPNINALPLMRPVNVTIPKFDTVDKAILSECQGKLQNEVSLQ